MTTSIRQILNAVAAQLAAEAFLLQEGEDEPQERAESLRRLRAGNRHVSKFLDAQAVEFLNRYQILAQERNDTSDPSGTGFSGTLIYDREKNEYTLSFRSTEFIEDAVRDSASTNELEIKELGWALGQISEMEAWYRDLRADPRLLKDKPFHVTGYSLGGHLAMAFNVPRK